MKVNKDVYKVVLIAKSSSVNIDNIEVVFKSLTMKNEDDEEIIIKDRQYDVFKERCSDGIKISLYIVNDASVLEERIDWLMDEEYYIDSIDIDIHTISSGNNLEFEFNNYGEQTTREMKVIVAESLEVSSEYLINRVITCFFMCLMAILFISAKNYNLEKNMVILLLCFLKMLENHFEIYP